MVVNASNSSINFVGMPANTPVNTGFFHICPAAFTDPMSHDFSTSPL
jgi:hypothetical protein